MADLDYAFLADYATVEGGRLTAVGASFTHVDAATLPSLMSLSIAGRVRAPEGSVQTVLHLSITTPSGEVSLQGEFPLHQTDLTRPYRGKVGLLFAATTAIWLSEPGVYDVNLELDGEPARHLAFEVSLASA